MLAAFSLVTFLEIMGSAFVLGYLGCAMLQQLGFRFKRKR